MTRTAAAEAIVDYLAPDPTGSGDTDYLVLGEQPIRPLLPNANASQAQLDTYLKQRGAFDRYDELFEQATAASIPELNANRFFLLSGQTDR